MGVSGHAFCKDAYFVADVIIVHRMQCDICTQEHVSATVEVTAIIYACLFVGNVNVTLACWQSSVMTE